MQPIGIPGVQISFSEYRKLYRVFNASGYLVPAGLLIAFAGYAIARGADWGNNKNTATSWYWLPPIVLVVAMVLSLALNYRRKLRRAYAAVVAAGPADYILDQAHVLINTTSQTTEIQWPSVTGATVRAPWLLLYVSNAEAILVDLRRIQAPATEADIFALLRDQGIIIS